MQAVKIKIQNIPAIVWGEPSLWRRRRNTQKECFSGNLFELFADILQIIEVNLTKRCFMSIMIPMIP